LAVSAFSAGVGGTAAATGSGFCAGAAAGAGAAGCAAAAEAACLAGFFDFAPESKDLPCFTDSAAKLRQVIKKSVESTLVVRVRN
jgi:hypothetical protein